MTSAPSSTSSRRTSRHSAEVGDIPDRASAPLPDPLVAEGRLSLDDQVTKLLPEASIDEWITVRHLLTHTSGIDGDIFTDTGRGDDCVSKYVALLGDVDHLFAPGEAYSYCNAGFVLLGRLIEVLDERSWDESLHARLIMPLGLRETVTLPEEAILRRAAVGHLADGTTVSTWQLPRSLTFPFHLGFTPLVLGFAPSSWGSPPCLGVRPLVLGFAPLSWGSPPCLGVHPLVLGFTHCCANGGTPRRGGKHTEHPRRAPSGGLRPVD
ncbi:beta-lactamase family protein [Kribbella qitaiheensis]|uniref:Beta-lactamase family protein n=1 Tax=Kribbella qitaiheensis TaxID=1544730 RepID=A0A7G6X698_9ACTN|nr:serine hydrolase domain-containing protein [Kribbella qitaiheensis]QNE21763.1 beta-lactamase family protein [Kribbella qitaiheensis]